LNDGPGAVLCEAAFGSDAHADDAIPKGGDLHFCVSGTEFDSMLEPLDVLNGTQMLPALCE